MKRLACWSVLAWALPSLALKTGDWKTCADSGFCRRGRALSARARDAAASWKSPYSVVADSVQTSSSSLTADIESSVFQDVKFSLSVRVHSDGVVRVGIDETTVGRKWKRYDGAAGWAMGGKEPTLGAVEWKKKQGKTTGVISPELVVSIDHKPLKIALLRNGKEQVVLNGRGLLHLEHNEQVANNDTAWFVGDTEDAYREETWSSWTDSKPKGPESLSIDISFPNHPTIYGLPQRATRLALPTTTTSFDDTPAHHSDPYRLHNADVFEYLAESPMSLYGSIPLIHAHNAQSSVGIWNAVGSETWVDVSRSSAGTDTHFISESGILDVFLLPGPAPANLYSQYADLTGRIPLPPMFGIAYHQCRWNYVSSDDVRDVVKRFDDYGSSPLQDASIPVDVLWLDIEYAEEHKYFVWDKKNFPDPVEMIKDVVDSGRKMVVIIDPHLKRADNYPVYVEARDKGLLVKTKGALPASESTESESTEETKQVVLSTPPTAPAQVTPGSDYEGWCWTGSSAWTDFFNPATWEWWIQKFKTTKLRNGWSWTESTDDVWIWNDMNEPSVFNGPEITMPKDNVHHDGWEHRDIHNINGMMFTNLTYTALLSRSNPPKRPFVLTRSFYSGSQKFGAIWTGDNLGTWEHMAAGVKMVLANSVGGMSFVGADTGGFFGNPGNEMLFRWYQSGIFQPFFRAHAHIDTKRREPYLLPDEEKVGEKLVGWKAGVRETIKLRYKMLPVWYNAFREASVTGLPVVRPHYVVYPQDTTGFTLDDQYFIGSSGLLVKPVTEKSVESTHVYLPAGDEVWYNYFSQDVYYAGKSGANVSLSAPLPSTAATEVPAIPLLLRGGSIIPTRERHRRSSALMTLDPFKLTIALDRNGQAKGEVYLDDGEGYGFQNKGEVVWRGLEAEKKKKKLHIKSTDLVLERPDEAVAGVSLKGVYNPNNAFAKRVWEGGVRVEKISVLGVEAKPKRVYVQGGLVDGDVKADQKELAWTFEDGAASSTRAGKIQNKSPKKASVLSIKDPRAAIGKDWEVVVEF